MNNIKTFENFNNQDIFTYIKNNDIKSVKNYINSGYDLNIKNNEGETALIIASRNNNREIIELLLNYHADEFILNDNNDSFYDYLNDEDKKYFLKEYPNKIHNAILYWYKKPFTDFIKDYNIK